MSAYHCSACGVPISYKWGYCSRDQAEWRRVTKRPCADRCGRQAKSYCNRCGKCQWQYQKALYARPNRRCSCGSKIPQGYLSQRCRDCASMASRELTLRRQAARAAQNRG